MKAGDRPRRRCHVHRRADLGRRTIGDGLARGSRSRSGFYVDCDLKIRSGTRYTPVRLALIFVGVLELHGDDAVADAQ